MRSEDAEKKVTDSPREKVTYCTHLYKDILKKKIVTDILWLFQA